MFQSNVVCGDVCDGGMEEGGGAKEEGEGENGAEAGNFEYLGSESNKLQRMARLRASGDPAKTLRLLELNRLRCKRIRWRTNHDKDHTECTIVLCKM